MCSVDDVDWQACEAISPSIGDEIYIADSVSLAEHSIPSEGATRIDRRTWVANSVGFGNGNNDDDPTLVINSAETTIQLSVRDDNSRTGSRIHTISAILPLPDWIEVKPF